MSPNDLAAASTQNVKSEIRRETIRSVRWALVIACAYLVLFSDKSTQALGLGGVVIAIFLASNLVLGRIPTTMLGTPRFNVGLALVDAVLIGASLYFAGQLSTELVILCLGVLVLAIAGLSPGAIAIGTVALALGYLGILAFTDNEALLKSGILLRAPFLLSAAIVYAWLVEMGRRPTSEPAAKVVLRDLATTLDAQRAAIERCHAALAEGLTAVAQSTLNEISVGNQEMRSRLLAGATGPQHEAAHATPAVAHAA